jgi:hypothetical protein
MRVLTILVSALVLACASAALAAGGGARVVRVSGGEATLSLGQADGVQPGFKGQIFYVLDIAGQKRQITVAEFTVLRADAHTCTARVFNTKAPVNTGYMVLFSDRLVAPGGGGGGGPAPVVVPKEKGSVYVSSEPAGAQVFIEGRKQAQVTPCEIGGLPVGDLRVELRKEFYFGTAVVKVEKDQIAKVAVELKAEPGDVKFTSQPYEARVYVDDQFKGTTPLLLSIPAGRHAVRMEKDGHFPADQTLFVKGGTRDELELVLKAFANLALTVTPPDADVTIDGEAAECPGGKCKLQVTVGKHEVLCTRDRYLKFAAEVSLDVGETRAVAAVLRQYPSVEIESAPDKVYVELQGNRLGRTPLKLEFPEEGEYEFVLTKDQYASKTVKVRLTAGRKESVSVKLQTLPRVEITSTPDDAEVMLEGKSMGRTPVVLTLEKAGTYVFTLQKQQYKPAELRAQVDLGDAVKLDRALEYQKDVALQIEKREALASRVRMKKILGWSFSGVGVACLGASVPFFLTWSSKSKAADRDYEKYHALTAGTEQAVFDETIASAHSNASSARTASILAWTFTGVGLAATGFGVYNLLTIPKAEASTSVTFAPYFDGSASGFSLTGTW